MRRGAEYIHWDEKRKAYANQTGPIRHGVGMSIFMYKVGVYPISLETSSARMILNQDGSIQVELSATEIGQGADTVFTQMASETTPRAEKPDPGLCRLHAGTPGRGTDDPRQQHL